MRAHAALWYRAAMIAGLIGLTVVAWWGIGGRTGAIVWLVGFLLFWAATRFLNRMFGGFLLGDERKPEDDEWAANDED